MSKILKEFVRQYKCMRTLTFAAEPHLLEGQSEDEFWDRYMSSTIYQHDVERTEAYPIMKDIMDMFHKWFIDSALTISEGSITELSAHLQDESLKDKERKEIENTIALMTGVCWEGLLDLYKNDIAGKPYLAYQKALRETIIESLFQKHEWWQYATADRSGFISRLIKSLLEDDSFVADLHDVDSRYTRELLEDARNKFNNFSVYFKKYFQNRDNMYSKEAQGTSIANRIVNENFPKFAYNIEVYKKLLELCPNEVKDVENNLSEYLNGKTLEDIFTPTYFSHCFRQKDIELYNWIIGGNPNQDVIGLNSIGNKYLQDNPDCKIRLGELKMKPLFKQILSDRERPSYLPEQFSSGAKGEKEMIDAIDRFFKLLFEQNVFENIQRAMSILSKEGECDLSKIYVVGSSITELSRLLYGNWDVLGSTLRQRFVTTKKAQSEREEEITKWIEKQVFSLAQIMKVEKDISSERPIKVLELLTNFAVWRKIGGEWLKVNLLKQCRESYLISFRNIKVEFEQGTQLSNNSERKAEIKSVLDSVQDLLHVLKLLSLGKKDGYLDKDAFYTDFEELLNPSKEGSVSISQIVPLYNKVRSFLTRKIGDEKKMLLKFDTPTLADGWAVGNEPTNNATILVDNDKYYLMLANPQNKPRFQDCLTNDDSDTLTKIVYRQIADASKDIPNLMVIDGATVRKTGRRDADGVNRILEELKNTYLPERINDIRCSRSYSKTSETFDVNDSREYLAYYMQRLIEYQEGEMSFNFKKPEEYDSYSDFLDDVKRQKFSMTYAHVSRDVIHAWMKEGKVFVFQIYNKDFAEGKTGTDNIHTMYWKSLFSESNMSSLVFQLNGNAELFLRHKLAGTPIVHKKGDTLVNKTFADGSPVPNNLYQEYQRFYAGILQLDELSDDAKKKLAFVRTNVAKTDIVKNKRFYKNKILFHIPISINATAPEVPTDEKKKKGFIYRYNERTRGAILNNKKDINIIGIDRGERNLIYVSVINQRGENIIPPRSFNIIESKTYDEFVRKYNYLEKLQQSEKARGEQRKAWDEIENIKDLKSGYLSLVVHEISKLMVKYNAIVVLEDLNYGFKRGRFSVERQVYQNFEKALINKLNYLVFKKDSPSEEYGNIDNGLQLTAPFSTFKDMGRQSGWLFYVPAGYTSKIDPATGFVNLFSMTKAKANPRQFFENFDKIEYRDGAYYFTFNYSKTDNNDRNVFPVTQTDYINQWTVCSCGDRIHVKRDKANGTYTSERINLTHALDKLLADNSIDKNRLSLDVIKGCEDDAFFSKLFYYFSLILQMRNSEPGNGDVDYLISPVVRNGRQFNSNDAANNYGISDADANGAYHIALKGLYLLRNDFPEDGINNEKWFEFAQTKPYLND